MNIILPNRLTYNSLRTLMLQNYESSIANSVSSCSFDWRNTIRATLPEIVSLLSWASKLAGLEKRVTWVFRDTNFVTEETLVSQQAALDIIDKELFDRLSRQIGYLRQKAKLGQLSIDIYTQKIGEIETILKGGNLLSKAPVSRWLALEKTPFQYMGLLSYLDRYQVFHRAIDAKINIEPRPGLLPRFTTMRATDTASLELRPIHSPVDVVSLVDDLCKPDELARVLGTYSNLDVARGGTLANILVAELGHNVSEHANANGAWLCTRLVSVNKLRGQANDDPSLTPFLSESAGFLEIIVCDDGNGLTSGLESTLAQDQRLSVSKKYGARPDAPRNLHLIDYAFDRLASTKRDIVKLLHLERQLGETRYLVASGLYWVWNVVRSHHGVLSVHTADLFAWYDFTKAKSDLNRWEMFPLQYDPGSAPFAGTMVRICLPLTQSVDHAIRIYSKGKSKFKGHYKASPSRDNLPSTKLLWIGEIARKVSQIDDDPTYSSSHKDHLPLIDAVEYQRLILKELQRSHCTLSEGDILVLDLYGVRHGWTTKAATALCHFMLEMNFTSTIGRSTVVLWNVPSKVKGLFEEGINIAGQHYSHLDGVRRGALMISEEGDMRLFCGWEDIERKLGVLKYQSELNFEELGSATESATDEHDLIKFITENNHLFEQRTVSQVRLRAWPNDLTAEAWSQRISWLNDTIDLKAVEGGVHRIPRKKYFRLPSTGYLVEEFYQFRGLLSNNEACTKIAWLVAQVIAGIINGQTPNQAGLNIVSVSRSTMPLIHKLMDSKSEEEAKQFNAVVEGNIEELELRWSELRGPAILITDVISSGSLGGRIIRALPGVQWLGIIALLDSRESTSEDDNGEKKLGYGINVLGGEEIENVPVYALARRQVKKLPPTTYGADLSEAIDEINVSPVEPFEQIPDAAEKFWSYVREAESEALLVGHYSGSYHHYIYKVDVGKLLAATNPHRSGETFLAFIVQSVLADLRRINYNPNKTVIMHPPRKTSHAEVIAKSIQDMSGALYRHVLYKDNFAGQWRFSPFVQHGVPLEDNTLILIDDGTNTGETLMGLLDAATAGKPSHVMAYVGITRMLPHKNSLFRNIRRLKNVKKQVKISFMLGLSIPVYGIKNCPICKFQEELTRVGEYCPILGSYATQLKERVTGQPDDSGELRRKFLWSLHSELDTTRLREAIETRDYHSPSYEYVNTTLQRASGKLSVAESENPLLDLAFIICAEPEITSATVFSHYLSELINAALHKIEDCDDSHVLTYVAFVFHLLVQLRQKLSSNDRERGDLSPWEQLFNRKRISIQMISCIITFSLSQGLTGRGDPPSHQLLLSLYWLEELYKKITEPTKAESANAKAIGYIYLREALASLRGARYSTKRIFDTNKAKALYALADDTAYDFWWHSSNTMQGYIDSLIDQLNDEELPKSNILQGPIDPMFRAFGNLCELQQELSEIEKISRQTWGNRPGGDIFWSAPPLSNALTQFIHHLAQIGEFLEEPPNPQLAERLLLESEALKNTWNELYEQLNQGYGAIFPEVYKIAYSTWQAFGKISGLPDSIRRSIKVIPPLTSDARAFMPQILLRSFLMIAIQNLETAAFSGWPEEEIRTGAEAYIEMEQTYLDDGHPAICVRVVDNGRRYPRAERGVSKTGISNVERMAKYYNASVKRPYEFRAGNTAVELIMMQRINRDEESQEGENGNG
jgi:hypothetical protein